MLAVQSQKARSQPTSGRHFHVVRITLPVSTWRPEVNWLQLHFRTRVEIGPGEMNRRKTDDIYSACRDGDDIFVREWIFQANNDVNQGLVCSLAGP